MSKGLVAGIKRLLRHLAGRHDEVAGIERLPSPSAQDPFARRVMRRVRLGVVRRGQLSRARSIAVSRPRSIVRRLIPRERSDLPLPPLPFVEPPGEAVPIATAEGRDDSYGAPRFFVGTTGDPAWDALWTLRGTPRDPSAPPPTLPRRSSPPSNSNAPTSTPHPSPPRQVRRSLPRRPVAEEIGPRPRRRSRNNSERTPTSENPRTGDIPASNPVPRRTWRRQAPKLPQTVSPDEEGAGEQVIASFLDEPPPHAPPDKTAGLAHPVTRVQAAQTPPLPPANDEGQRSQSPASPPDSPARRTVGAPPKGNRPLPTTHGSSAAEKPPVMPSTLWERIVSRLPLRRRSPARRETPQPSSRKTGNTTTGGPGPVTGGPDTTATGKGESAAPQETNVDDRQRAIRSVLPQADVPSQDAHAPVAAEGHAARDRSSRQVVEVPSGTPALVQNRTGQRLHQAGYVEVSSGKSPLVQSEGDAFAPDDVLPVKGVEKPSAAASGREREPRRSAKEEGVATDQGVTTGVHGKSVAADTRTPPTVIQRTVAISRDSGRREGAVEGDKTSRGETGDRYRPESSPLHADAAPQTTVLAALAADGGEPGMAATTRQTLPSRPSAVPVRRGLPTGMDSPTPLPLRRPAYSHSRAPESPTPGGKVVQRAVRTAQDLHQALQPALTPTPVIVQAAPAPEPPVETQSILPDVDALAREVYRIIRRRLQIESERERGRV